MGDITIRQCGPRGPEDSPFVIVGEAPGKEEIKANLPFVGPSGQVLNFALNQVPKDSYPEPYITNTFKSLITWEKDPARLSELAMNCRPALLEELGKHKRRVIFAAGSVALQALTGNTSLKITQVRGKIFPSELADVGIVAGVHPAFLLRGHGSLRQFKADLLHAIHIARGGEPHPWKEPTWSIVKDLDELHGHASILRDLGPETLVAGDIETSGFSFLRDRILSMGYCWTPDHVYIGNGYKTDATAAGQFNIVPHMRPLFQSGAKWGWHNGKFDIKFIRQKGIPEAYVDEDSMLQSYALDEQRGIHDLETVSGDWLNSPDWKGEIDKHRPNSKSSYDVIPWPVLWKYQAFDIANTYRLIKLLGGIIADDVVAHKQYYRSLIPASAYLTDIETNGITVDQERVAANLVYYEKQAAPHIATIHRIAEEAVPGGHIGGKQALWTDKLHNSPKQLVDLIFDRLKIPLKKKGPLVRSTGDDILDKLSEADPTHQELLRALRSYRKISKALGTYVKPYTEDPEEGCIQPDGKIHTSYLIHGTATGRLSSRDPNLQNIPRDPQIRGQLVAPPGRMFIEPDLNQAELRSLAILSGDPELCKIYLEATTSLHEKVRAQIFGYAKDWSESQVEFFLRKWHLTPETRYDPETKADRIVDEQKMKAKNVNFGIIYGITEAGLAEQTGENPRDCKHWLEVWAETFPVAWGFIQDCRRAPLRGQNLVTAFGYRKRFQIVTPETLISTQNEAANMPHQSTASVITMHGGIRTYKKLRDYDAYFVNTVHDSLLIDAPADFEVAKAITELVCTELQQVPKDWGLTKIPFVADAKWGTRWGSLESPKKYAARVGWN